MLTPNGDRPDDILQAAAAGMPLAALTLQRVAAALPGATLIAVVSPANLRVPALRAALEHCAAQIVVADSGILPAMAAIMRQHPAACFIRIIGNNPFIDGATIAAARAAIRQAQAGYCTFAGFPQGLAPSEIITADACAAALADPAWPDYLRRSRDFFSLSYFRTHPERVRHLAYAPPAPLPGPLSLSITDPDALARLAPYLDRPPDLAALAADQPEQMTFAQIEPTAHCNLDCRMCARTTRRSIGTMPLDSFHRILDQLPQLRRINGNGDGEPLLNPALPEMLAAAKARGIMTRTITNANVPLPDDRLALLVDNLDILHISLDGATAATYEAIRSGADFAVATATVRRLAAAVSRGRGLDQFWINFVVQHDNVHELNAMVELTAQLGVPALNFKFVNSNWDRGRDDADDAARAAVHANIAGAQTLDYDRTRDAIAAAQQHGHTFGVTVHLEGDIDPAFSYPACGAMKHIFITWDGFLTPCCLRADPEVFTFGNILQQSAAVLFSSEKYRAFKRALRDNRPHPLCCHCPSLETLRLHHN
ncbi:MAG TPA: radical SAM protein [bacterium]|nr:radical SAM protein [bacterium]